MAWYPGWDSLDSVRTWHTIFEISGIAFLALLVGAEIFAFQYGHRKDELTAIAESDAEANRKRDADTAEARRKADVDGLQKQLADATKKVVALETKQPQRRLTDAQKRSLIAAMQATPGQKLTIGCLMGDIYGKELADDFEQIAKAAKWDVAGTDQGVYLQDPIGLVVMINDVAQREGRMPPGLRPLANTLVELNLLPNKTVIADQRVPEGTIRVIVGKKP